MSIMASAIDGLDNLFIWLGGHAKQGFPDYCDLETAEDTTILVSKDGSMMTLLKIDGVKRLIGGDNFVDSVVMPMDSALTTPMQQATHAMQFVFILDPERTKSEIRKMTEPAWETMRRLNMDMEDMLEERVHNLADWTTFEACYVALWTRGGGLSKTEQKQEAKRKVDAFSKVNAPIGRSQNPLAALGPLYDRHRSFAESFVSDLGRSGVSATILEVHTACREIRACIDASFTASEWMPSLPGDPVTPHLRKEYLNKEEWDIVWPKLGWQLAPRDAKIVGENAVEIGDKVYSPIYMDLFPRDPTPFWSLFGRLNNANMPWRASFLIEGDGLSSMGFKKLAASILGFTNGENKLINKSIEGLNELKNSKTIVKIRASFATWAARGEMDELARRSSDLARAVQSWGASDVSEMTGDPVEGLCSSVPGFMMSSVGTPAAAPLEDTLYMMPLARPCSPWQKGAVTFRSPDGKLLAYQPGSSLQTTWITLVFAKPGSGKSVLMNMTNLALCLSPGIKRLPRIAIIDIGPSSSGLISLLQEALPPGQKHFAAYKRMKMTPEYSINPFDTQLGCRFPTALERQFLINFVTLVATDVNSQLPFTGMAGLVTAVIDEMYKKSSDKEQPHPYAANVEPAVDEAIKKSCMHIDKKTIWWEIVDHLFKHGYIHEATIAQRHAVPVLADAALCAQDEKIRNTYGKVKIESGEDLITAFNRMVADALQFYSILARPTAFDLGDARVVSLDLDEVAKTGGVVADRQTAVMYMLARFVLAKDFYLTENALGEMPYPGHLECPKDVPAQEYRQYHRTRVEEIREDLKRICFDEFHRTSKAQAVRDQVLVDMREGRKWAVDVTLASQALEDFDKTMMEFATGLFVMDGGNAQTVEKIAEAFGFDDPAEKWALQHNVHGPRKGGGTFLAKFSTNAGWYTLLLTSTLGPIELWAFSTTAEDVSIRNKLYELVGPKVARKLLGKKYPGGSAKSDVENRKEKMKSSGAMVDQDGTNVIQDIIKELLDLKIKLEQRGQL